MSEKKLPQKLKELRKVNNYTQDYVAAVLGAFCTLWRSQMRFRAVALRSITAARF